MSKRNPMKAVSIAALLDDVWSLVVHRLLVDDAYGALLALLSTQRRPAAWLSGPIQQTLRAICAEQQSDANGTPPTGVLARLDKMTERCRDVSQRARALFEALVGGPTTAQTLRPMLCAVRLIRFAVDGTRALYERHDQLAGFSSYTFVPLTHCHNMDYVTVGELYIYRADVARYVNAMDCVLAPNFKSRRCVVEHEDVFEPENRAILVRNSMWVTEPGCNMYPEMETSGEHPIHALVINGYPLLHPQYAGFRKKIYIYSGRPERFKLALWLNKHKEGVLKRLLSELGDAQLALTA